MIWNDATDVILNGASVQAVYCNNQMIWPPMTAEPDAWTMLYVSSYNGNLYGSEVGFNIYDATHRKVYSTNGMHPVSSYELSGNRIGVSASGVSPFRVQISASGVPYTAFRMTYGTIDDSYRSYPMLDGSGSFVSGSGILKDSLKDSATFPTAMEDNGWVTRISLREYPKQIWVTGSAFSQYNSSVNASIFLFTPTVPTVAMKGGGGGLISASSEVPQTYTTGIKAGYFSNYSASMTRKDDSVSAFDMFNGIEHSGNVYLSVKGTTAYKTATNTNDVCTISVFPSTLVSGTYPSAQYLSGRQWLTPTAAAKATLYGLNGTGTMNATFTDDASNHAYVGVYCTNRTAVCSAHQLKCSATALEYYASTYIP